MPIELPPIAVFVFQLVVVVALLVSVVRSRPIQNARDSVSFDFDLGLTMLGTVLFVVGDFLTIHCRTRWVLMPEYHCLTVKIGYHDLGVFEVYSHLWFLPDTLVSFSLFLCIFGVCGLVTRSVEWLYLLGTHTESSI